MSEEKLLSIDILNQLEGEQYYKYFNKITAQIELSLQHQLLEYQNILDKAAQPKENDSKSCPRTRAQHVKIFQVIISGRKKFDIRCKLSQKYTAKWNTHIFPNKLQKQPPQKIQKIQKPFFFSAFKSLFKFQNQKEKTQKISFNQKEKSNKYSTVNQKVHQEQNLDEQLQKLIQNKRQRQQKYIEKFKKQHKN